MKNFSGFLFLIMVILAFPLRSDAASTQPKMPGEVREFTIIENDTTTYILKLAFDDAGHPAYFFRNIFTPVCLTGECKPVYINFYWDLVGNYLRYDFPPGEVLTKMDHKEFKQEDYDKLQDILSRPNSLLKDVAMNDLVGKGTENLADSVDAKAGATLKTVKNEVIDGAVYTCYTLWHIANGYVIDEIRRIMETYRDESLLHRFLSSTNHYYQYWAMERVIDQNGNLDATFNADVQKIMRGTNVYTARFALQRIADPYFFDSNRQLWLWETFRKAPYPIQIVILKKLAKIPFGAPLADLTTKELTSANPEQFRLMLKLLATQPKLPEKALQNLASHLTHSNPDYTAEIYRVLTAFHPKNRDIVTRMNSYKAKNP
ncbi:hypothetical protein [Larkinella rosea]|uniref:HEAT repeat domain-containing protein n=1 Tax=Larkinella rosea TaxID=2025312 RepID=A0A3P1C3U0_9BACT|nr:hypothetical protein [Larkinella rosea]RRB07773.1 hypothetical protein EHT25_08360 [Larkinella rosea]